MGRLHNRHDLIAKRRALRQGATRAEVLLWGVLRKHRLADRKFRRQHGVGVYVLDFYCPGERLAIELDGNAHDHEAAEIHDLRREAYLARCAIRVLRFTNDEVENNLAGVVAAIQQAFGEA